MNEYIKKLILAAQGSIAKLKALPQQIKEYLAAKVLPLFGLLSIKGKWELYDWNHCDAHNNLASDEFFALRDSGQLVGCCKQELIAWDNMILDAWITSIIKNMLGTAGAPDNLTVDYIVVGTGYTTVASTDTQLNLEFYRAAPTYTAQNGKSIISELYINPATANPPTTLIVSGTQDQITVTGGTGTNFAVNNRIRIATSNGFKFRTITNIATDTFDLEPDATQIGTPTVGGGVVKCYAEYALVGGDATGSANTGKFINRSLKSYPKTSASGATIRVTISFLSKT